MAIFYTDTGSISNLEVSGTLFVSGSTTFSGSVNFSLGLTGSLLGTASWAQNAVTASYITGSIFTSDNLALSSSYALTASYALNAGESAASITIADDGIAQGIATFINFIGDGVTATVSANTASINIIASQGEGSITIHTQSSPAVTWSFNHDLNNDYPVLNVWDNDGFIIVPGGIKSIDENNIEIYFDIPQTGYASAVVGGTAVSASFSVSSSYALTASYALNAGVAGVLPYQISSGSVTASVNVGYDGIFLIQSASNIFFEISGSSESNIYSDVFIIKNFTSKQPVLTVSESIVQFATQSSNPVGFTNVGSIWFTATDLYVGLE